MKTFMAWLIWAAMLMSPGAYAQVPFTLGGPNSITPGNVVTVDPTGKPIDTGKAATLIGAAPASIVTPLKITAPTATTLTAAEMPGGATIWVTGTGTTPITLPAPGAVTVGAHTIIEAAGPGDVTLTSTVAWPNVPDHPLGIRLAPYAAADVWSDGTSWHGIALGGFP